MNDCKCGDSPGGYDPAKDAAVDAYKERSAMLYEVLSIGTPSPEQTAMLKLAHRFLGRAMEAEVFDPEPRDNRPPPKVG